MHVRVSLLQHILRLALSAPQECVGVVRVGRPIAAHKQPTTTLSRNAETRSRTAKLLCGPTGRMQLMRARALCAPKGPGPAICVVHVCFHSALARAVAFALPLRFLSLDDFLCMVYGTDTGARAHTAEQHSIPQHTVALANPPSPVRARDARPNGGRATVRTYIYLSHYDRCRSARQRTLALALLSFDCRCVHLSFGSTATNGGVNFWETRAIIMSHTDTTKVHALGADDDEARCCRALSNVFFARTDENLSAPSVDMAGEEQSICNNIR